MVWVIGILVVVVIGLAVFAGVGRLGEMPDQLDDRPGPDLPDEQLTGADVRNVKFAVTTRGYVEQDCVDLAHWIADVLDAPGDESVIAAVRDKVAAQCRKYPVYG